MLLKEIGENQKVRKQMYKSYCFTLQNTEETELGTGRNRLHSAKTLLWNRLWTCRDRDRKWDSI